MRTSTNGCSHSGQRVSQPRIPYLCLHQRLRTGRGRVTTSSWGSPLPPAKSRVFKAGAPYTIRVPSTAIHGRVSSAVLGDSVCALLQEIRNHRWVRCQIQDPLEEVLLWALSLRPFATWLPKNSCSGGKFSGYLFFRKAWCPPRTKINACIMLFHSMSETTGECCRSQRSAPKMPTRLANDIAK